MISNKVKGNPYSYRVRSFSGKTALALNDVGEATEEQMLRDVMTSFGLSEGTNWADVCESLESNVKIKGCLKQVSRVT